MHHVGDGVDIPPSLRAPGLFPLFGRRSVTEVVAAAAIATTGMESFSSTVKSELDEHFDSHGEAKMELFDYIEVFDHQKHRHSTLG